MQMVKLAKILLVLSIALFISPSYQYCKMTQDPDSDAPTNATGDAITPSDHTIEWGEQIACPEFKNRPSCCNGL